LEKTGSQPFKLSSFHGCPLLFQVEEQDRIILSTVV
jgi:hypothetical protein